MASVDHKRLQVIRFIAILDMFFAFTIICYATFQFSHGVNLIPGNMTRREKLTRLVVYASLNYCFLIMQFLMAVVLFISSCKVMDQPVANLQRFKTWRAWSSVYMIILLLDAFFVSLVMSYGRGRDVGSFDRKIVSLSLLAVQICFRPIGMIVVKSMEKGVQHDMGGVFKNQQHSIIHDGYFHNF